MLYRKGLDKHVHTVTTATAPAWIGSVMTGSAPYTSIQSTFEVPTLIPGADGTTNTEASLWPGLGGYGTGSGLIQAGITLATTPTTASYFTWREYCCGDGDSNGYGGAFVPAPGDKILAQAWYCDANGLVSLNGGYGCSFLYDFRSGAVFSCTIPRGAPGSSPCWSVKALPLCSVNPRAANCMTVGQAAEFILENQSPQLTPPTDQFPRFKPSIVMGGIATTPTDVAITTTDPATTLLIDFPHRPPHITVALSTLGDTTFTADGWTGFTLAPPNSASVGSDVAALSRQPNSMEIFWAGSDGSIQDAYFYDGAAWKRFALAPARSAAPRGGIAAVSRIKTSMEIFWIAPDGSVRDAYWYEGANWKQFQLAPPGSAAPTSSIAAISRKPETMEVFWTAPNGSIQDAFWYEGAQWQRFELAPAGSASTSGGITGVSRIPGSMEIFWVGPNGSVQDAYWYEGASWKRFELAPANSASTNGSISSVARKSGTMEVFWTASNGSIQDAFWYENSPWKRFELAPPGSASVRGSIKVVARKPETMEAWWIGANGSVQDAYWYEGSSWQRFELAPPGSAADSSGLTAVSRIPGSMEVWWQGADGSIRDQYFYEY